MSTTRLSVDQYFEGILKSDRVILAKAITLVESNLDADEKLSAELLDRLMPHTGKSLRVGITGVPGVGKSTFIEALGKHITEQNKKVAVLTVDPSSQISKGSILGDKTRMEVLSKNRMAFIRPSSTGNVLGGVANKSREAMLLCEAAGFEVILIETVGVGQSEVTVKNMVDFFLLLILARAGDELQGIKKGIVEMADAIVITKADGDNVKHATQARAEYQQAINYHQTGSQPRKVLTCSAITGDGIADIWNLILEFERNGKASGEFLDNRHAQVKTWFEQLFGDRLSREIAQHKEVARVKEELLSQLQQTEISPQTAASELLSAYHDVIRKNNL